MILDPMIRNMSLTEVISLAETSEDPIVQKLIQEIEGEEGDRLADLENERDEFERALDDLGEEYSNLEEVADEVQAKLHDHLEKLHDILQADPDDVRELLQAYVDELES